VISSFEPCVTHRALLEEYKRKDDSFRLSSESVNIKHKKIQRKSFYDVNPELTPQEVRQSCAQNADSIVWQLSEKEI